MRAKNKVEVTLFRSPLASATVRGAIVAMVLLFIPQAFAQAPAKNGDPHWTQTLAEKNSPYPVLDSGVWADGIHDPQIRWISNNHIIFKNSEETEKAKRYVGRFNLSVWEIGKGVRSYTKYAKSVHVCTNDGVIKYSLVNEGNKSIFFYGKFGEEKPVAPPKMTYFDFMNCHITDNVEIAKKRQNNRTIIPLLDRHGYLDLGPLRGIESTNNTPVTFYRQGGSKDILPIKRKSAEIIRYYPFKDAYFIHRIVGGVWVGKAETTWWLSPKGEVTEVNIPHGPWIRGGHVGFYPTHKGIFLVYHGGNKSSKDPGFSGGYLVQDSNVTKLIDGHVQDPAVSPNGCKIAFAHYPYLDAIRIDDPGRVTLKMIDLCMEEKKP